LSPELRLLAARIVPAPPPKSRLPRPDDPTPRQPPLVAFCEKQSKSSIKAKEEHAPKRAKDIMRKIQKVAPTSVNGTSDAASRHAFKVPEIPHKLNGRLKEVGDVFWASFASKDDPDTRKTKVNPDDLDKKNKSVIILHYSFPSILHLIRSTGSQKIRCSLSG
jgi:hypothetical protein